MEAIGSYFSNFAPISSPGLLIKDYKQYKPTKIPTDISIDYRPTLDRYIEQLSSDYRPSVDRPSTECRPSVGQVSPNYRREVGKVSVNEKLYRPRHIWNDYRPCLDRVSTDYRPTFDQLSTAISTDYRPNVERVSTEVFGTNRFWLVGFFPCSIGKKPFLVSLISVNQFRTWLKWLKTMGRVRWSFWSHRLSSFV